VTTLGRKVYRYQDGVPTGIAFADEAPGERDSLGLLFLDDPRLSWLLVSDLVRKLRNYVPVNLDRDRPTTG
jgi:hypothetical protein